MTKDTIKNIEQRAINRYKLQQSLREARQLVSSFKAISFNPDTKELMESQKDMEKSIRHLADCIELLLEGYEQGN